MDDVPKPNKPDTPATDLGIILDKAGITKANGLQELRKELLTDLAVYVTRRDARIWNHAYHLGKEAASAKDKPAGTEKTA